jgi:hypothetical protein
VRLRILVFLALGAAFSFGTFASAIGQTQSAILNPKDFGAIADCNSHPLSEKYHNSLESARRVYPFITSLSQETDYAALKAASNEAFGADGVEHSFKNRALNKPLYLPGGCYNLGNDTWLIRNAVGVRIYGAGRLTTRIISNRTVFGTDGLWYSSIEGIEFSTQTDSATVAVDIDGNVPGHPYATRGVQGNSFSDLMINGGGSKFGFALNRQGFSGAQGDHNDFWNCHFSNASVALYFQNGFNALNNAFHGGDFQHYSKHAIQLIAGSVSLFATTFESTVGYQQILNDGWDIDASSAGVNDSIIVDGARTESLRFYRGAFSQYAIIRGLNQTPGLPGWSENTSFSRDTALIGMTTVGNKLFRVTTAGTSARTAPAWPTTGTVRDGSVTWTQTDFEVVHLDAGILQNTSRITVGDVKLADNGQQLKTVEVRADYSASLLDDFLLVDATQTNIVINLPRAFAGKTYTIKKWDTSPHKVTVRYSLGNPIELTGDVVIPGGSRGFVTLVKAGGVNLSDAYWVVSKSF